MHEPQYINYHTKQRTVVHKHQHQSIFIAKQLCLLTIFMSNFNGKL